jgi:microcystin-dependent protein
MNVPIGTIILWADAVIPMNWQVCDGTNGTPDLRNRFVRGASDDSDLLDTGGSTTHVHTTTNATGSAGNHNHNGTVYTTDSDQNVYAKTGETPTISAAGKHNHAITLNQSDVGAHTHTVQDTKSASNMPPYIKLVFIMRMA